MLSILERVCQKLEAGESVDPQHLEQAVAFIKGFADRWHHGKEEDLLFPAMEEAGISGEGGPIGVMLVEHVEGRNYVKGMSEAIERYGAGDRQAWSEFVTNGRNYIALLQQHIFKEDNILYPMADMRLTEKRQEELSEQFEVVEREKLGIAKREELLGLLEHLSGVYLE